MLESKNRVVRETEQLMKQRLEQVYELEQALADFTVFLWIIFKLFVLCW